LVEGEEVKAKRNLNTDTYNNEEGKFYFIYAKAREPQQGIHG
jgi:hypothetical protein